MEQLTKKKRLQVVYLYFSGLSSDQIAAKAGISKGSVGNIITELKVGNYPETADLTDQIETLRELAVNLAKLKLPAGQAAVGIAVLKRMYELDLDPSDMERWPLLLNSIKTQDDAQELIKAAYAVRDIQQKSGLSLPALEDKVKQLGDKAKELETVTVKIGQVKTQITDLTAKKKDLSVDVSSLEEKYKWLIPRVEELENREAGLLNRHKAMLKEESEAKTTIAILNSQSKKLMKTGLSITGLVDFNLKLETVAKHHGLKPSIVRQRLLRELKSLNKDLGIETLLKNQQQLLKETNQTIDKRKGEKVSLEAVLENLQQQKQNLEASIQEITASVLLDVENLLPAVQNTAKQITEELEGGCTEALSAVHQLKEKSIQVGQDIGQYEGVLKESEWVKRLTALVHGENNLDASDVRAIALLVNRGITAWLGQHEAKSPTIGLLALNAGKFLKELEQWQLKA
jgi:predicted  nucleic acid-binding Zn-ribbon protein